MIGVEIIETTVSYISSAESGIVRVESKKDCHLEPDHLDENATVYRKLMPEDQFCVLAVLHPTSTISKEAREKLADDERNRFKKAAAYVTTSLGHRLLLRFHMRLTKNTHPVRVFANEEDALTWLRKYR